MTRDELDKTAIDAEKAFSAIKNERRDKIQAFAAAIMAEYAPRVDELHKAYGVAHDALKAHISDKASHPWDGKRVFRMKSMYDRWSGRKIGKERIDGIVEVVRLDSQFPVNMGTWSRPELGSVIIRKVKKDGKPSL